MHKYKVPEPPSTENVHCNLMVDSYKPNCPDNGYDPTNDEERGKQKKMDYFPPKMDFFPKSFGFILKKFWISSQKVMYFFLGIFGLIVIPLMMRRGARSRGWWVTRQN